MRMKSRRESKSYHIGKKQKIITSIKSYKLEEKKIAAEVEERIYGKRDP